MATPKTRHDVAAVGTGFLVVMVTCSCVAWPASSSGRDSAVVDGQVAHLWHPHLSAEVDAALGGELVSSYSGSELGAQQLGSGSLGTRCHGSRRGEGGSCCWTRFWFRRKKSWIPGQSGQHPPPLFVRLFIIYVLLEVIIGRIKAEPLVCARYVCTQKPPFTDPDEVLREREGSRLP